MSPSVAIWLMVSAVGLGLGVWLGVDAYRDLRAARRNVAADRQPARILPIATGHVRVQVMFIGAFAANLTAGLLTFARVPVPESTQLIVPALIAGNALVMMALWITAHMRRAALIALELAITDARTLEDINAVGRDTNAMLHRMERKDADVAAALAQTIEDAPNLQTITETVQDNNDVLHRLEGRDPSKEGGV